MLRYEVTGWPRSYLKDSSHNPLTYNIIYKRKFVWVENLTGSLSPKISSLKYLHWKSYFPNICQQGKINYEYQKQQPFTVKRFPVKYKYRNFHLHNTYINFIYFEYNWRMLKYLMSWGNYVCLTYFVKWYTSQHWQPKSRAQRCLESNLLITLKGPLWFSEKNNEKVKDLNRHYFQQGLRTNFIEAKHGINMTHLQSESIHGYWIYINSGYTVYQRWNTRE